MPSSKSLAGTTVCYVSTEAFGGVWRTFKQAQAAVEAGARVAVVGYRGMVPDKLARAPFEAILVDSPFRFSENPVWAVRVAMNLTLNRWRNAGLTAPRSVEALRRRHRALEDAVVSTNADVVQAVDLPSLDVAHEAARRLGAKLVYAAHELWIGFLKNPDVGISPELGKCWLSVERDVAPKADLVIVVSDLQGARLEALYGIPKPLTIFNSPPWRVEQAKPVGAPIRLVFHGGLSADRNLDGLIRAVALLAGRATLDVHGYGRTIDPAALQELIESLSLGELVKLRGPFDNASLLQLLEDYDVGVMAARSVEENFEIALPNKLFDCMCAGLAVAMNDSPAIREIVQAEGFGVLLDPSSPETIASGLLDMIEHPERIAEMKRAAVEAAPRYWWPEQARKLVSAFERILATN